LENYLKELNEAQKDAVCSTDGPNLVIAGAGSGKTKVLTYRIAYLLNKGIDPRSILALTFTNKAASEMKERVAQLLTPSLAYKLSMGTFHSVFARVLRKEGEKLGYTPNFTIYDASDSKSLVKAIIKDLNLDDSAYKPAQIHSRISYAKNHLVTPGAYFSNSQIQEQDRQSKKPRIADIYKLYFMRCKKADAMDFDDLLLNLNILFRDFPEILKYYQESYQYILVDEFQDTNLSQYMIIHKLAKNHRNICVVGDDAQSIYAFRGAKIENILNFKNDFTGCKTFKLERNYRSTCNIVNAANSVIAKNSQKINKKVWSKKGDGSKIQVVNAVSDRDEAYRITKSIDAESMNYKDTAILYRTNAQSRVFEEIFRKFNIPYKIYGSLSFYQRKEIKDIIAYFRLITNNKDDEAFKRVINYPARGIGKVTLDKIEQFGNKQNISLWEASAECKEFKKVQQFHELITHFSDKEQQTNAFALAKEVVEKTGILNDLSPEKNPENLSKSENIQELLNSIQDFSEHHKEQDELVTISWYLENVSLLIHEDTNNEPDQERVSLMTIHASKGLEFDNIFIVGLEEELFPSKRSAFSVKDLEEERRLFYVALTRAKEKIIISYTNERYKWGDHVHCKPSRFLYEIDNQYIDLPELTGADDISQPVVNKKTNDNKPSYTGNPVSTMNKKLKNIKDIRHEDKQHHSQTATGTLDHDDPQNIQTGMLVEHIRFGKGKVINIEGEMPNKKATVFFNSNGQKQLLLKFAKLKIVEQ